MKSKILFSAALICWAISASAQTFSSAVDYLNFLNKESLSVSKDMWEYTRAIARTKGAKKIEARRKEVLAQISASRKSVQAKTPYKAQHAIKDAFSAYLKLNYAILNDDYSKIVDMEAVAEQSYDAMEAYMLVQAQVNEKMKQSGDELSKAVKAFAEENNITLTEDNSRLSQKLERANLAFGYYQPIYLIFFKAYVQEANFLAALNTKDLAGAEQARTAMISAAEEGIAKLQGMSNYDSDASLRMACIDMLNFLINEGKNDLPKLLEFTTTQENFTKMSDAMSKKKKSDITKEENEKYNALVKEYNTGVKTFNELINRTNNERAKNLNAWNNKVSDFLGKHAG
jgi:hypothetical protein